MTPRALWVPLEVDSLPMAAAFYTDHLGLSVVDGWAPSGADPSRGIVLRVADGAYVELSTRTAAPPPSVAFELPDAAAVDEAYRSLDAPAPRRHARGHYGFDVAAPGGDRVLVWSAR